MVNKKKYPKQVLLNLTEKQYRQLIEKSRKNGLSYSEFLRTQIEIAPKNITSIIELKKNLIKEIHKIGVNINQIAHAANMGQFSKDERNRLYSYISKFNDEKNKWVSLIGGSENTDNT